MNSLLNIKKELDISLEIMFNLFDAYVLSILNYNCEVWGFYKAENIERVQRKFCKWLLNVKMLTNTLSLYSELGGLPLYIERYVRIAKYWLKLHGDKSQNCILTTILSSQRNDISNNSNAVNWSS
jgi:hypothetical protein